MTRSEIEPRSPGPRANTLPTNENYSYHLTSKHEVSENYFTNICISMHIKSYIQKQQQQQSKKKEI